MSSPTTNALCLRGGAGPTKRAAKGRGRAQKGTDAILDDPTAILSEEKSILYQEDTDLQTILTHPLALSHLQSLPSSNPLSSTLSALNFIPPDALRRAIAEFKENGASGYHDAEWIAEAAEAGGMRKLGKFDSFVEAKFREEWGIESDEAEEYSDSENEKEGDHATIASSGQTNEVKSNAGKEELEKEDIQAQEKRFGALVSEEQSRLDSPQGETIQSRKYECGTASQSCTAENLAERH